MAEQTDRKRTLRHPENENFCGCVSACYLTKTEAYRKRVKCRYRHGEVKPLGKILPPSLRDQS